jgi:predicted PurR-regulated permease PerM
MTLNINIENKNVIKIFALAVLFTVGVFALLKMYDALLLILIAFFLAVALNPAVNFLSRYMPGRRRGPAIAIVVLIALTSVFVLVFSIAQPVARETSSFARTLPETVDNLRYRNENVTSFIDRYDLSDNIDSISGSLRDKASKLGENALGSVGRVGNSVVNTFTVLVIAVLMLTGGPKILGRSVNKLYRDEELRKRHELIASKMYRVVTGYVNGQLLIALVASIFALGALALLKVPYPLPLAAIVFVFGLIPLIGNTLAAVMVILATLILKNVPAALVLLAYFILYQQIENITLQPLVQGKTTQLPPLIIFISVILGVALLGPIGGLFAIPAAGCAKVLLLDYLDHRDDITTADNPRTLFAKAKHKLTKAVSK